MPQSCSPLAEVSGPDAISTRIAILPARLDENAVAALDAAANTPAFDLDLLRTTPVRDIRVQIERTLALIERMDHRALLAKQSIISCLTGADVEARLEFELAGQKVFAAVRQLCRAAENGKRVHMLLKQAREQLVIEQERLEDVIDAAKALLAGASDAEPFVVARFERRLSNIMAMHAANMLTFEQFGLAEGILAGLLDRFTDVDTFLIPLWQRNVLALAHASGGQPQRKAAQAFADTHKQLITYLAGEESK